MKPQYAVGLIVGVGLLAIVATFTWCNATRAQGVSGSEEGSSFSEDEEVVSVSEDAEGAALSYECSDSIILVVSPDKQFAAAFSKYAGVWRKQEIKPAKDEEICPLIASQVVAFQAGDKLFAFSAPKGEWRSIDLKAGEKADLNVMADMAYATVGNRMYAFGAPAASWDVVEVAPAK